jgi:hypothetical protein
VSWQAAMVTAAYSCDRMTAKLIFSLGDSYQQRRRSAFGFWFLTAMDSILRDFVFVFDYFL